MAKGSANEAATRAPRRLSAKKRRVTDAEMLDLILDARSAFDTLRELEEVGTPRDSVRAGIAMQRVRWYLQVRDELIKAGELGEQRGFDVPEFPVSVQSPPTLRVVAPVEPEPAAEDEAGEV